MRMYVVHVPQTTIMNSYYIQLVSTKAQKIWERELCDKTIYPLASERQKTEARTCFCGTIATGQKESETENITF